MHSQPQRRTCKALKSMIEGSKAEYEGNCWIYFDCSGLVCEAFISTPPMKIVNEIKFNPCSKPISVHVYANSSLSNYPFIDKTIRKSGDVDLNPLYAGMFSITFRKYLNGVFFGVSHFIRQP